MIENFGKHGDKKTTKYLFTGLSISKFSIVQNLHQSNH
jgi:hypothetical protein